MLFSFLSLQMGADISGLAQKRFRVEGKYSTQKNVKVQFSQVKNSHRIASILLSRPLQNIETNIQKGFLDSSSQMFLFLLEEKIYFIFERGNTNNSRKL